MYALWSFMGGLRFHRSWISVAVGNAYGDWGPDEGAVGVDAPERRRHSLPRRPYETRALQELQGSIESFHLDLPRRGVRLFVQVLWPAQAKPLDAVLFVHGLHRSGSVILRHANSFLSAGLVLVTIDLRGHGRSSGISGLFDRVDTHVQDIVEAFDEIRARYGSRVTSWNILGVSLGGQIALRVSERRRSDVRRLVLQCPLVYPVGDAIPPAIIRMLARVIAYTVPELPILKANKGNNLSSIEEEEALTLEEGNLAYTLRMRARTALAFLRAIDDVPGFVNAEVPPVLLQHGDDDRVVSLAGSKILHDRLRAPVKKLRVYKGTPHAMMVATVPACKEVVSDLIAWLRADEGST